MSYRVKNAGKCFNQSKMAYSTGTDLALMRGDFSDLVNLYEKL